jgi:hypothetical protein
MIEAFRYTVKKFGSCIYLNNNLIQVRELEIPDEIIQQGIGFSKKYFNSHDINVNKKRYSFDILFISKLEFIDKFLDLFKELDLTKKNTDTYNKFFNIYCIAPYNLKKELGIKESFSCNTVISTQDFFSFNENITLNKINNDLTVCNLNHKQNIIKMIDSDDNQDNDEDLNDVKLDTENNKIYYFNLDLSLIVNEPLKINKGILKKIGNYDDVYKNIFNLTNKDVKIQLNIPNKNGIGIWDRSNINGLYELFKMIHEIYPEYTSIKNTTCHYFHCNTNIILDKPSKEWLNNELLLFKGIYICNYDESLIKTIWKYKKKFNLNYSFLFFFSANPKKMDDYYYKNKGNNLKKKRVNKSIKIKFVNDNKFIVDDNEYNFNKTLEILSITKYAFLQCTNLDTNLLIICMITGCIPILNCFYLSQNKFGLVNYLNVVPREIPNKSEKNYHNMKKGVMEYYENHISPKGAFKDLVNKLFVRNI